MHSHTITKAILLVMSLLCFRKQSFSQVPVYELICGSGQQYDRTIGVTYDNSTGKYRQWLCYDTFGNVFMSATNISALPDITDIPGSSVTIAVPLTVNGIVTSSGFNTMNLNGASITALGNGSQGGFAVGNGGWFGDSNLICLHNVVNFLDQGCQLSSESMVPSIDRSIGITTSAMIGQSTATLTPITNMQWLLVASKNYSGWCEIPITFAASATVAFGLVGPGTPTSYNIDAYGLIGAAAIFGDISLQAQTTWTTTKTSASGAPGTNVTEVVHVNFQIQNGTSAGALTLNTSANGTNTITIGANAVCHVMQLN